MSAIVACTLIMFEYFTPKAIRAIHQENRLLGKLQEAGWVVRCWETGVG